MSKVCQFLCFFHKNEFNFPTLCQDSETVLAVEHKPSLRATLLLPSKNNCVFIYLSVSTYVYMYHRRVGDHGSQKGASNLRQWELQVASSCHVGAENQMWLL